ncbi:hypothetical protein HID58_048091 [Brassica napus]|uniref:Uncharacterized protein n=1 Tax=Brassica napus TaxID=3708 RepID=A0ABQ8B271_BRANA|nr:hypothetical protein HID58_048091 [Brassica napus]
MSDLQAMPSPPDLHHQLFTDSPAATSPPPPLQIKYVELCTDTTSFASCSATATTDPVTFSLSILSLLGLWFCHFRHRPLRDSVCYCAAKMVIVFVKNSVSARGVFSVQDPLTPSHVAGITVQECGLARPARYYVTAASPSHYAVLNIDVLLRQPLRTSLQRREIHAYSETDFNCSQNPLVGFFNVDFDFFVFFRTRALELKVKIFYGVLLSLATTFFCYLTVEYLSGHNLLNPSGV